MPSDRHDHSEDLFADTRMSFGEHIEDLRTHLVRALKGLAFCLMIGFVLDGIGYALGWNWFGIGRPMMDVITSPVQRQLEEYHQHQLDKFKVQAEVPDSDQAQKSEPKPMQMRLSPELVAELTGKPIQEGKWVVGEVAMSPLKLYEMTQPITQAVRPVGLTTLMPRKAWSSTSR